MHIKRINIHFYLESGVQKPFFARYTIVVLVTLAKYDCGIE
jgi:hypothetical protein